MKYRIHIGAVRRKLLATQFLFLAGVFGVAVMTASFNFGQHKASATVPGVNEIASLSSSSTQGNQYSGNPSISGDGRYVAFQSAASNLVSGDTNGSYDVFVRDRASESTARISVSTSGTQGNSDSDSPQISYDGRYVVFESVATNLVSGDTNGTTDVFVHDMQSGSTTLASTNASGTIGNSFSDYPDISADGRFVTFESFASNLVSGMPASMIQIYVKDMTTGAIKVVSVNASGTGGNNYSRIPSISCDGGVIAFFSDATNLVSGDTNGMTDVFVAHMGWSSVQLTDVTISANGSSTYPDVSCNGNVIAYGSTATNLVNGDTNSSKDVFSYNRLSQVTSIVSVDGSGALHSGPSDTPSVSDDGRYIAFHSNASLDSVTPWSSSFYFIYVRDMKNGTTQSVSLTTSPSGYRDDAQNPSISPDGSYVAYESSSPRLLSSDTNMYGDAYVSQTGF